MQCPYCISDINDAALVCTTCQRDLVLLMPLQLRLADLEKRLQDVDPERNATLVARIAELEGKLDPQKIVAPNPVSGTKNRLLIVHPLTRLFHSKGISLGAPEGIRLPCWSFESGKPLRTFPG